ncbi:hypothetical protein NYO91_18575, partial [Arhodomonas aquaeolei]|uniref:hypothetical protein n=1 Tax=Arhodomonas aquaeolei TaxID=2369 RepID=UPI0021695DD2
MAEREAGQRHRLRAPQQLGVELAEPHQPVHERPCLGRPAGEAEGGEVEVAHDGRADVPRALLPRREDVGPDRLVQRLQPVHQVPDDGMARRGVGVDHRCLVGRIDGLVAEEHAPGEEAVHGVDHLRQGPEQA